MTKPHHEPVEKLKTHINGFDLISMGGLPTGRTTLVSGSAGSAKTVLSVQFLAEGIIKAEENGVFVTFEESPKDIRKNMLSFNWPIEAWEKNEQWVFVDASPDPSEDRVLAGDFDFGALLARIEHAIIGDSVILVSGATGTGKTLIVTEFIAGGIRKNEKCLLFAFEESREQLFRNAIGWGVDFEKIEEQGQLKVICEYPEVMGTEDHLIRMKSILEGFKPNRVAVDSLSAIERVSTIKSFREFVIGLTSFIKHEEVAGLFTSTTSSLLGGSSITEAHISTITDSIILLRYVEILGEMRRGMTVLKMRGSMHDKNIREFTIDGSGMHVGNPFRKISGILAGHPNHVQPVDIERWDEMYRA